MMAQSYLLLRDLVEELLNGELMIEISKFMCFDVKILDVHLVLNIMRQKDEEFVRAVRMDILFQIKSNAF